MFSISTVIGKAQGRYINQKFVPPQIIILRRFILDISVLVSSLSRCGGFKELRLLEVAQALPLAGSLRRRALIDFTNFR